MDDAARPATLLTPEQEAVELRLAALVDRFYTRVRADPVLGPVFNGAIHDWPDHLGKLSAFWSSVMLGSGRYKGNPMGAHLKHAGRIEPAMFARWLGLWAATAREMLPEREAAVAIDKAERIAESLQLGMFFHLGNRAGAPA